MPVRKWDEQTGRIVKLVGCLVSIIIISSFVPVYLDVSGKNKTTTVLAHGRLGGGEKKDHGLSAPWSEKTYACIFSVNRRTPRRQTKAAAGIAANAFVIQ